MESESQLPTTRNCIRCKKSCLSCEYDETPRWCFCCPECADITVEVYDPKKHGKITFIAIK